MESWPVRAVFDSISNSEPGSRTHTCATAEIQRRLMETELASLEVQQKSADAASDAAKSARWSAFSAFGALAVAAISLIVSIVLASKR